MSTAATNPTPRTARFTLEHYERMVDLGAFDGEFRKRVELLDGEIVEMSPIGMPHNNMVSDLTQWSHKVVAAESMRVYSQSSIRIPSEGSMPEPDLMWVVWKAYKTHPEPSDVLLVIEVADSSLTGDRGRKLSTYAKAGIADYWIVNLIHKQVEVYRDPQPNGSYATTNTHGAKQPGPSPLCLPEATLDVAAIFDAGR